MMRNIQGVKRWVHRTRVGYLGLGDGQNAKASPDASLSYSPAEPQEQHNAHDVEQTRHVAAVDGAELVFVRRGARGGIIADGHAGISVYTRRSVG